MAYKSRMFLRKVIAVQKTFLEHRDSGLTQTAIWRKHIRDQYFIERGTFYRYLAIPAKKLYKELIHRNKITRQQKAQFFNNQKTVNK